MLFPYTVNPYEKKIVMKDSAVVNINAFHGLCHSMVVALQPDSRLHTIIMKRNVTDVYLHYISSLKFLHRHSLTDRASSKKIV